MKTNWILTAVLASGFIVLFYRLVIRPLFADLISQRIEAQERGLEKMAENGEVQRDDFCYTFLASALKIRHSLREVSISTFVHFVVTHSSEKPDLSDVKRFLTESESKEPLRKIYSEHAKDIVLWVAINSPVYSFVIFVAVVVFILLRVIDTQLVKLQAGSFIENEGRIRAC